MPFLGDLPLQLKIREYGDEGRMDANFDDPTVGACLEGIGYRLVKNLAASAAAAPPQPPLPVLVLG